jgi:hypothetical protein
MNPSSADAQRNVLKSKTPMNSPDLARAAQQSAAPTSISRWNRRAISRVCSNVSSAGQSQKRIAWLSPRIENWS